MRLVDVLRDFRFHDIELQSEIIRCYDIKPFGTSTAQVRSAHLASEGEEVVVEVRVGHDLSQIVEVADVILDVQINLLPTQDVGELLLHHTENMTQHVARILRAEEVMSEAIVKLFSPVLALKKDLAN